MTKAYFYNKKAEVVFEVEGKYGEDTIKVLRTVAPDVSFGIAFAENRDSFKFLNPILSDFEFVETLREFIEKAKAVAQ